MSRRHLAVVAVGVFIVGLLVGYAADSALHADVAVRGVSVDGTSVSGMTEAEVASSILDRQAELVDLPAAVSLADEIIVIEPGPMGFVLSAEETAQAVLQTGRTGGLVRGFFWWLGSFFVDRDVASSPQLDGQALTALFDDWDNHLATGPEPGIRLEAGRPVAIYPEPVSLVDRPATAGLLLDLFASSDRLTVDVPTTTGLPAIDRATIDAALEEAIVLLSGPVTLSRAEPQASLTLQAGELASAFRATTDGLAITVGLDPVQLDPLLDDLRSQFSGTFQNAFFDIDEAANTVVMVPGRPGVRVDAEGVVDAILTAVADGTRTGTLPITDGVAPEITLSDLAELRVEHLVSEFTTYHDCCQDRVDNIQLMADTIDGTLLLPGDEFSINGFIGERTTAKGYLPAGTIVDGEIIDTIGGGVSQFATTMYNAVFWGGYTDIVHKPHSIYFSRYPEGIEATVDFPSVDLVFRNDTAGAVLINTKHTPTSITVQLYGSNGGRIVSGDQSGGATTIRVLQEGDPAVARRVTGQVSGRHSVTAARLIYQPDPTVVPGTEKVVNRGRDGWSVTVTRTITEPGGTVTTQEWVARYRPDPRIVAVHPCDIPPGQPGHTGEPCPPPPTTTTLPTTTTTIP
ncbi:MAG: VanW family protein [Acidimicrobiia bacterium]|nr:VanW family protein [Acidimicrobiia bacterium]